MQVTNEIYIFEINYSIKKFQNSSMEENNFKKFKDYINTKESLDKAGAYGIQELPPEYIKYVDHSQYHGCWDTGHANCDGNQYDEIMAIGDELYAIHYNDNHGAMDDHIAPFLGTLNHDEIISALIDVGFDGYFTLECVNSLITYDQWQGKRRRFDSAMKLREPQLFMQRHMEAMMYDTAEWMLKEYGIFEK